MYPVKFSQSYGLYHARALERRQQAINDSALVPMASDCDDMGWPLADEIEFVDTDSQTSSDDSEIGSANSERVFVPRHSQGQPGAAMFVPPHIQKQSCASTFDNEMGSADNERVFVPRGLGASSGFTPDEHAQWAQSLPHSFESDAATWSVVLLEAIKYEIITPPEIIDQFRHRVLSYWTERAQALSVEQTEWAA